MIVLLLMVGACTFQPTKIYVLQRSSEPFVESPQRVEPSEPAERYIKALGKDPCHVSSALTGALSIDTDAMDLRMAGAETLANRFACLWEKQRYAELYELFTPELRAQRSLASFVNIMIQRQVQNKQPYAVRVDKLAYFQEATIAHIFFNTDYRMTTADLERSTEPRLIIEFSDDHWYVNDMTDVFFVSCAAHNDCRIDAQCQQKCGRLGLSAEAKCVSIVHECACSCVDIKRQELTFYDMVGD